MKWKTIKFYLNLHWIKLILAVIILATLITTTIILSSGLKAWKESESYLKQTQLASLPLQMFMWMVMGLIQGVITTWLFYWLIYKRGAGAFTHVMKKAVSDKEINIKWTDVIGMDEAKQEALEMVNLIKDRTEVQRMGGNILKGLLMLGPPGCGKTYLAKAIATEAQIPFLPMSGSEFVEMFVGVGAGRIRSLFKKARLLAELKGGCIIFIDEIDALGASRSFDTSCGGNREHNQTLNQLLVEMDGLKEKNVNIIVIGATNTAEMFLDTALLRPGRFDRKIYVDRPNLEDRQKLFEYYLKKVNYDKESVKIDRLARITVGNTPAEIANLIKESALIAIRRKSRLITMKDTDEARERIALGIKRRFKYTENEKWQTAYHEAGHAIVTYLLVPSQDVFKITITPRGHTGGVTWTPEREEILIPDRPKLLGEIKSALGSYAAERLKLGHTTAGVTSDFNTALNTAHNMVWRWGMGKSGYIGNFHALDFYNRLSSAYISEETKARLDNDLQDILQTCLKEAEALLRENEPILERLAKELVAKEELNYDEIEAIFKEFGKNRAQ